MARKKGTCQYLKPQFYIKVKLSRSLERKELATRGPRSSGGLSGRPSSLQLTREKAGLATQNHAPRLGKPWAQRAATLTAHRHTEKRAGQPPHVPVNTPVRTNMPVCPRHLFKSTKWALGFDLFPWAHALCRGAQGRHTALPNSVRKSLFSSGRSPAAELPANCLWVIHSEQKPTRTLWFGPDHQEDPPLETFLVFEQLTKPQTFQNPGWGQVSGCPCTLLC